MLNRPTSASANIPTLADSPLSTRYAGEVNGDEGELEAAHEVARGEQQEAPVGECLAHRLADALRLDAACVLAALLDERRGERGDQRGAHREGEQGVEPAEVRNQSLGVRQHRELAERARGAREPQRHAAALGREDAAHHAEDDAEGRAALRKPDEEARRKAELPAGGGHRHQHEARLCDALVLPTFPTACKSPGRGTRCQRCLAAGSVMGAASRDSKGNGGLGTPRCAHCGTVSHQGAKFCSRCGRSIVGHIRGHDEPAPFFADARHETPVTVGVERRQVTVVFCDLVGSTPLAKGIDAEDYKDIIQSFSKAVADAVSEFDGYVARYVGDAALVCFGFPKAHEDDAERAVHAALRALENIASLKAHGQRRLQARVGIATGLVVVGNLHGAAARNEPDLAGETPNLAARLQGIAEPNTIVAASATRQLVGELFEWRDLGLQPIEGLPEPVKAWQVIGTRPVTSRFEAQRDSSLMPMLGRDECRATLRDLWQQARDGAGRVALIFGEAGVGKSRLAAAILEDADHQPRATLRYFCSPYRQGSPLHPCIQQLEHAAGFSRDHTQEEKLAKLKASLGDAPEQDMALIAELERLARQKPTLMVFEDAQWSDETSRELLGRVVSRLSRLPVLLLVLARPECRPDWIARAHVSHITLNPLTPEVSTALVHLVAKDRPLSPQVVAEIVARTDGIPLFLEEVTRAIVESQDRRAAFRADGRQDAQLPLTLQASLLSRLDRLGRAREI